MHEVAKNKMAKHAQNLLVALAKFIGLRNISYRKLTCSYDN